MANASEGIAQLFWFDRVSYPESAVIAAIRQHLQSKETGINLSGPDAKEE